MKEATTTIFRAAAVRDAAPPPANAADFRPGAVAVRGGRIVAVGEPDRVEKEAKHHGPVRRVDLPDRLILPAMVNAHAHLDLTDIGPVPYENAGRDFIKWIEMVMKLRPRTDEAIAAAVRRGLRMSREAGVGWIGDIAGSEAAVRARINATDQEWVNGTSYLECFGCFGTGVNVSDAAEAVWNRVRVLSKELKYDRPIQIELQPHAPYSAGLELYRVAHNYMLGSPSTHLAETLEELQFVREASGPLADFLRRIGKWDDSIQPQGVSPIEYLKEELQWGLHTFLAHCNYVDDGDIKILATLSNQVSVAYCPIASEYFGHKNHRYRDMLAAGANVCLGTDSILCQPPDESYPLGIMAQARRLYRRDRTNPKTLLEMATWRGRGLTSGPDYETTATLCSNAFAYLVAIRVDPADATDALVQALLNDNIVEPLNIPKDDENA